MKRGFKNGFRGKTPVKKRDTQFLFYCYFALVFCEHFDAYPTRQELGIFFNVTYHIKYLLRRIIKHC